MYIMVCRGYMYNYTYTYYIYNAYSNMISDMSFLYLDVVDVPEYTVHYTLYSVRRAQRHSCMTFNISSTIYTTYIASRTLHHVHCTAYITRRTLHHVHCTTYIAWCTLHGV